ncbi:hypothetical protein LTS08_007194 [Lithohypha guttulata]|uniref:Major facilitator superfamily (MFS) profile domain-containing protein n=1 Tax=Lithohypha guttulata TaxID=1690604 RepID=A0AAN7T0X8_9EURO|nr:hypothetical protein LTR05_003949 [Lithohypha guttulata]KAK5097173.1 hypothetical protein LTS08_007194 [Lithohypha guttulata]
MAPTQHAMFTSSSDSNDSPIPNTRWNEKRAWLRQSRDFAEPGPPPDGGWESWSQVLGGFIVVFLCWGFILSFGLFQTFYASQDYIDASQSAISWIGSIQIFLLMAIGAYSGSASDSGYFRLTTIVGQCLFVFGIFMTSVSREYYQLVLSHGVTTGIGMGLFFIPTMSVVSTYWTSKRKSLAIGCMLCGAAVGGMLLPTMFNSLLPRIGVGWTLRTFGFIAAVLFGCAQVLLKKRLPPKDEVRILDFEALKDLKFILFVVGSFLNFLGLYFAFFFIGSYVRNVLGVSFSRSNMILLVINGTGIPGRLIPMWLADQRQWTGIRPVTVQIPLNLATSILLFAWIAVKDESSAYIFAAFYGFAANAVQSLFPATLADMTSDPRKIGAQIGWGFTISSFSCLTGNPIGGILVQADGGEYTYAQIYAGICTMCGCAVVTVVAWLRIKEQQKIDAG